MSKDPSPKTVEKMINYAEKFREKTGTKFSTVTEVTEAVITGLAANLEELGRPLCPCNFYPDKVKEAKNRRWICPCDDMQIFKYCHCLLFLGDNDMPITEYLPKDHEGLKIYGIQKDPTPTLGRAMKGSSPDSIMEWYGNSGS